MKVCGRCKAEKSIEEFNRDRGKLSGRQARCRQCEADLRASRRTPSQVISDRVKIRERQAAISLWFKEYKLGLKCETCPESHPATLDFHHEADKDRDVSRMVKDGFSPERIKAEIAKCRVLCANCHRKLHYQGKAREKSTSLGRRMTEGGTPYPDQFAPLA